MLALLLVLAPTSSFFLLLPASTKNSSTPQVRVMMIPSYWEVDFLRFSRPALLLERTLSDIPSSLPDLQHPLDSVRRMHLLEGSPSYSRDISVTWRADPSLPNSSQGLDIVLPPPSFRFFNTRYPEAFSQMSCLRGGPRNMTTL